MAGTDSSIRGKVNNEVTDAINFYFSEHVRRSALKTMDSHWFEKPDFGYRMEWLNTSIGLTRGGQNSLLVSYGF